MNTFVHSCNLFSRDFVTFSPYHYLDMLRIITGGHEWATDEQL